MPRERGPIFRVVVGDGRFDAFVSGQREDLPRVVLNERLRAVQLAVEVHAAIGVDRPPLAYERVGESEVHHANPPPLLRDVEGIDEVDAGLEVLIDQPFGRCPLPSQQTSRPRAGQPLQRGKVSLALVGPLLSLLIPQHRVVRVSAQQPRHRPLARSLVQPVRRRPGVGINDQLLIGHHAVAEPRRQLFGVVFRRLGAFKQRHAIIFGGHDSVGIVQTADDQHRTVGVFVTLANAPELVVHHRAACDHLLFKGDEHGFGHACPRLAAYEPPRTRVFEQAQVDLLQHAAALAGACRPLHQHLGILAAHQGIGRPIGDIRYTLSHEGRSTNWTLLPSAFAMRSGTLPSMRLKISAK